MTRTADKPAEPVRDLGIACIQMHPSCPVFRCERQMVLECEPFSELLRHGLHQPPEILFRRVRLADVHPVRPFAKKDADDLCLIGDKFRRRDDNDFHHPPQTALMTVTFAPSSSIVLSQSARGTTLLSTAAAVPSVLMPWLLSRSESEIPVPTSTGE